VWSENAEGASTRDKSVGRKENVRARTNEQPKRSLFYQTSNRKDGPHRGLRGDTSQTDPIP